MEVVLTPTGGLPDRAYLSVRAGESRKQLQGKCGQELHFDFRSGQAPAAPKHFMVDVFEKVGSSQVRLADLVAAAADPAGFLAGALAIPCVSGSVIKADVKVQTKDNGAFPEATKRPATKLSKHQAALDARNYLEGSGVQKILQEMVQDLLTDRPQDPVGFMVRYLEQARGRPPPAPAPRVAAPAAEAPQPPPDAPPQEEALAGEVGAKAAQPLPPPQEVAPAGEVVAKAAQPLPPPQEDAPAGEVVAKAAQPLPPPQEEALAGEVEAKEAALPEEAARTGAEGPAVLPDLARHHGLVAKVLHAQPELFSRLRAARTPLGTSLWDCICPGTENRGHPMIKFMGLVAGDANCYETFADIFTPVLSQWHGAGASAAVEAVAASPDTSFEAEPLLLPAQEDGGVDRGICGEACASRSLAGLAMVPTASAASLRGIEGMVRRACEQLQGELAGRYWPLAGLPAELARELASLGFLFHEPDALLLRAAGFNRHWPEGRGIFLSDDRRSAVWVNEGEHLKLLARVPGEDVAAAARRVAALDAALAAALAAARSGGEPGSPAVAFAWSRTWGYLTADPSLVGVPLEVSVTLQLSALAEQGQELKRRCSASGIRPQLRATAADGEAPVVAHNFRCRQAFGKPVQEQVNELVAGCRELLQLDVQAARAAAEAAEGSALAEAATDGLQPGGVSEPAAEPAATAAATADSEAQWQVPLAPGAFPTDVCPSEMPDLSSSYSFAAQVLRAEPAIYSRLRQLQTSLGTTFATCVKPCFDNRGHPVIKTVGLVAGDEECYDVFRDLFDPIIRLRHPTFDDFMDHPCDMDLSRVAAVSMDGGRDSGRVISTSVRMSRNLRNLSMPTACSFEQRREVERLVSVALAALPAELSGQYFPLPGSASHAPLPGGMSEGQAARLREEQLLFEEPDSQVLASSGVSRDWPDARGVFVDEARTSVVWVNEVDHLRMAVLREGDDLLGAFARLAALHNALGAALEERGHGFVRSARLGFLGSCPSRLGTCLDVSATLRLPHVSQRPEFRRLCREMKLQAHLAFGPHIAASDRIWEVMSAERLGCSEVSQVNAVLEGCRRLLELDDMLSRDEAVEL